MTRAALLGLLLTLTAAASPALAQRDAGPAQARPTPSARDAPGEVETRGPREAEDVAPDALEPAASPGTETDADPDTVTEDADTDSAADTDTDSDSAADAGPAADTGAGSDTESDTGSDTDSDPTTRTLDEAPADNPFGGGDARRDRVPEAVNDRPSEGGSSEAREEDDDPSIPERERPDYDGRGERGMTVEEGLLWIPRVLFFPVHLIFEYVLRAPIGWFLTTMEQERWQELFVDFFTWNERKTGLVPTAFFDFGFIPSVGLFFFWNDFLADGNDLRVQVAFGGPDWLRATVTDRVRITELTELAFTADAWRRPDQIFEGLGWDSSLDQRSRYIRSYVDGRIDFRFRPWRASEVRFGAGVIWNDFDLEGYNPDTEEGDPSLREAVDQGFYPAPPGLDGYVAYYQRLDVAIDTRPPRPEPGHGVRLEGYVHQGFDVRGVLDRRWMRYGGALGGFVDLGGNRVLGLSGHVRFADPLGTAEPVPFVELAGFGGEAVVMSGFLNGQLYGRSAAAMTLEYRYPIWVFLDGSLHASVGNVFDEHLSDFDPERLRASFGFGLRSIGDRDQSFNFLIALGTSPFVRGGSVESVRIVIGSQQGF